MLRFTFIGCHHDDIELGAGVFVQRVIAAGHKVTWLILTDDDDGVSRRGETLAAAERLGVPAGRVLFAGLPDGGLRADRPTVAALRSFDLSPDVVVTHTAADSHNDHREAKSLALSTFREAIILQYPIHISACMSDFSPRFFINQDDAFLARKEDALASHRSQRTRIAKRDRHEFEARLGELAGLESAEAFELSIQVGGEANINELMALNDAPFHSLWYPLIGDRTLTLLYEAYLGQPPSIEEFSRQQESVGRNKLRNAFARHWYPRSPLYEEYSTDPHVEEWLATRDILLAGGPVNNPVTAKKFNSLDDARWIVGHSPELAGSLEDVYVMDKSTGRRYLPRRDDERLVADLAVLSVLPNPYASGRMLVSCAGVHGLGTQALLEFLASPTTNQELLNCLVLREGTLNIPVEVDVRTEAVRPFDVAGEAELAR